MCMMSYKNNVLAHTYWAGARVGSGSGTGAGKGTGAGVRTGAGGGTIVSANGIPLNTKL